MLARKNETIVLPDQWCTILENHGMVFRYGKDWNCMQSEVKQKHIFKISESKILNIENEKVNVKSSYSGLFEQHSLLKKSR